MRNFRLTAAAALLTALIAGPSWSYTPGIYEASAQGMKGPVKVAVTFSKDAVTSVKVIEEKETAGIGTTAAAELPRQIVEAQSTKIDGLSGATVTSKAIFAAVEDCIRQAKGDPNQPARSTAPKHAGKTIEAAEDVVIIGSGFSGLAAAVNAAEHGARVTVLEKMSVTGGASAICGGQWAIMGTKLQKKKGVPYDPPQALVYDLIGNGHLKNDLTTLTMFAENSPRAADWAINRFKPKFIDQKLQYRAEFQFDRSLYLKGGCGPAYRKVEKAVRDLGIKIHTDTKAERLIVKDGRIVGVEAHKKDGTKYIFSSKAVLLATGGYGANKAMLIEPLKSALYYGPASATGDGHRMAQAVGAKLELMEFGKRYPNGVEAAPGVAKSIIQGNYRAWLQSGILVNNEGRRLINEKASNHDILTVLEKQKGGMLYLVMDQATWNGFRDGVHTLGITDEDLEKWLAENGRKAPIFAHGATLAEAAAAAGIDGRTLEKTVARYNELVKLGKDEDFGRPAAFMKAAISSEGPYYIVEQKPRFATTMGSVIVDENLQVLNQQGKPIPGLYAAGEIVNAVHGDDSSPGMNVAWGFTSGKVASESILKALGRLEK